MFSYVNWHIIVLLTQMNEKYTVLGLFQDNFTFFLMTFCSASEEAKGEEVKGVKVKGN